MRTKFIVLTLITLAITTGMIMHITSLFQLNSFYPALFLIIGLVSFLILMIFLMKNIFLEAKLGLPANDELSKKIKLFSAGRAYFYSLYIWLVLFAFQSYLDKDDLIMLGILGMILSLIISWLFIRNKRGLE